MFPRAGSLFVYVYGFHHASRVVIAPLVFVPVLYDIPLGSDESGAFPFRTRDFSTKFRSFSEGKVYFGTTFLRHTCPNELLSKARHKTVNSYLVTYVVNNVCLTLNSLPVDLARDLNTGRCLTHLLSGESVVDKFTLYLTL